LYNNSYLNRNDPDEEDNLNRNDPDEKDIQPFTQNF
jgi:hypothetical protein